MPHEIYLALGSTAEHRQATYQDLFQSELEPGLVDQIRQARNGNFALGSARFWALIPSIKDLILKK